MLLNSIPAVTNVTRNYVIERNNKVRRLRPIWTQFMRTHIHACDTDTTDWRSVTY